MRCRVTYENRCIYRKTSGKNREVESLRLGKSELTAPFNLLLRSLFWGGQKVGLVNTYERLARSIDEFDCVEPLVWNGQTGTSCPDAVRLESRGKIKISSVAALAGTKQFE